MWLSLLTNEDLIFKESMQKFINDVILQHVESWENLGDHPRSIYRVAADLEILTYIFNVISEENDLRVMALFCHELSQQTSAGLAVAFTSFFAIVEVLNSFRDLPFINLLINKLLKADAIIALAVTEPAGGSDINTISTTAKYIGTKLQLDGKKTMICNGFHATHLLITAKYKDDLALFLVEKPKNLLITKIPMLGWRSLPIVEFTFNETLLEESFMLAEGKDAKKLLYKIFTIERLNMGTLANAMSCSAYQSVLIHIKNRSSFGKPLIENQSIGHRLAEIRIKLELMTSYIHKILLCYRQKSLTPIDVSMYKRFMTYCANEIIDECLQLYGGQGFIENTKIERFYRDVRILRIGGGTDEMMLEIISKHIQKNIDFI